MTTPIRIMIVDDHPMVAQGIQSVLEEHDDIDVVGTLGNGRAALDALDHLDP
ncbi:MAG: DNA-binding response regulator, partial [Pseudomonadota bacterium]